jgi:hypothetical protein
MSSEKEYRESQDFKETPDPDAPYGGREARLALERKLLWKLDLRMSIMVFIYILNYVFAPCLLMLSPAQICHRLIGTTLGKSMPVIQPCFSNASCSAARLRGFEADLHLQGQEFATLLSILYVGYIIMQVCQTL